MNTELLSVTPQESWDLLKLGLVCPSGIVCFDESYIIVDRYAHKLCFLDKRGGLIKTVGGASGRPFSYPRNICVDDEGMLWVTDSWNHSIKKINRDGKIMACFGGYGENHGEFSEPWGISFHNGEIIVSDRNNHRIQIFDKQGNFIRQFGLSGPDREYFESDKFKTGFVYEYWLKTSNRFSTVETCFRKDGYEVGNMEYPLNISVSERGEIAVVDSGNDRIQRFSHDGELIGGFTKRDGLDFFADAVFLDDDSLLVSGEVSDKVFVVDKNNDLIGQISAQGAKLNYICVENKEIILVLDSWNKKLYKFLWK